MPAVTLSPEEARKLLLSGARPPEHLIVTGSLDLSNLEFDERERLAALPDRLQVQGDLTLSSITGLTLFSRHLRVAGHAEIEQCQNFWSLGESIEADRLTVDGCSPRLASLPERTVVHRELTMRICPMLESLPDGLNLDSLTVSGGAETYRAAGGFARAFEFAPGPLSDHGTSRYGCNARGKLDAVLLPAPEAPA